MRVARFIQGIRRECPKCKKYVTPIMFLHNDADNITRKIELVCECGQRINDIDLDKLYNAI